MWEKTKQDLEEPGIPEDGLQSELLTIFDRWLNQLALSLTPPSGQLIFPQIDCRSWDQINMQ